MENREFEENKIEGRNAVLEAFRAGRSVDKLFVLDGNQDGPCLLYTSWDDVVALSFLSYDDSFYELLPYEAITKEEYDARKAAMRPFNPSLLTRYEYEESDFDIGDSDCSTGACPVR